MTSDPFMKLRDLAERLDCRLEGDGDIEIVRVAGIQDAGPGDVTFLANPKYEKLLATTRASAVILRDDGAGRAVRDAARARPVSGVRARRRPVRARRGVPPPGVHALAARRRRRAARRDVSIGAVRRRSARARASAIARSSSPTSPSVPARASAPTASSTRTSSIRERVTIGDRVVLQNGVVIGGDGYGFVRRGDGTHEKIPQVATVVIEDDVELGANTTVDRPAVGETRIRAGTKIDNLVQIGHGVTVGRNVLMAAQVGIAGSTEIGDDVVFGGQVGVGGHLTIGRGAIAVGQSGVTNSLDPGAMVAGYPAIDSREWRKASVIFRRLPELKRRIEELEAQRRGADRAARRRRTRRRSSRVDDVSRCSLAAGR